MKPNAKVLRLSKRNPLPLQNSGDLTLFPVGCSTAFSKRLYQNNWLITKGTDHVMIDCGTRTPEALHRLGRPVTDISNWIITHSHADHIGGLEEVMLMSRYVTHTKPSMIITAEYQKNLWERSLSGGNEFNESHHGSGLGFEDFWNVLRPTKLDGFARDTHQISVGSIDLKLVRTRHYPEQARDWSDATYSVGLVIDDRILFTGDTQFDPQLLQEYDDRFGFEWIFHDVQFFTGGVHAGIDEIATLPENLKERMILMHYPETFATQVKRVKAEGFVGFARQGALYRFS